MKKILLSIATAACLASFATPAFAQDTGGDKAPAKSKVKSTKEKKEKKSPEAEKKTE
ncbi:MAG TPA: hypothetical protein VFF06_36640 [Polyangia bacterium]|nr:hypothetical protein [Polyangia bacterium]